MSTRNIIWRPRRPTAATGLAFALSGIGLWAAKTYFASNAFAESATREPPSVFSSTFGSSLRLESSETVNHNTKRLRFEFPVPEARSGLVLTSAVLTVTWPKGKLFPTLRPYTPVTPIDERGHLDLMVKKYPNGKASTYLHSMTPGESLYFLATLKGYRWTPNKHPHVTLIAGGAGITPMYQLIQGILLNPEDKTKITLVFGVNSNADILLRKEFEDFEQRFPGRFKAVYTVSSPSEDQDKSLRKGYVTKALLEDVVGSERREDMKVFVCGPPAMEKALLGGSGPFGKGGILDQLGYKKDQIHKF